MNKLIYCCALLLITRSAHAQPPDFGRDILPILSDKCFHCHGPDAGARKGNLRLDTKEGAFRIRKGHAVIVPGKSADSELIQRIHSDDASDVMPPKESNRSLTAQQKALLKQWIDSGAKWDEHWAFQAAKRPAMPAVQQAAWIKQPLDHFVLAKLEAARLTPQRDAPREAWLRRVSLDLTGLPPSLSELDAFLADTSATAYEKQVDRLLASPRYGERMATEWLDVSRYADTHGYQMDRYRPMWPYRDWVVQAFNNNLPYDQFITWQLAGDLLPNATREQRLATAFNRLHMQNEEGGVIEEEYRVSYVVDRVNTFGTAFLGMTFDCTRCHDHKYDPFTMKDYYSLFSFFQNIDESGQTSYFTSSMPVPTLLLTNDATDKQLAAKRQHISQATTQLNDIVSKPYLQKQFQAWLKNDRTNLFRTRAYAHFTFDEIKAGKTYNRLTRQNPANAHEQPQLVEGHVGKAVLLDGENGFTFPKLGHVNRTTPFSFSLWIKSPAATPRAVVLHHSKAPIDAGSRGYELLLEDNRVAFGLHHMWPGNALKVKTQATLPANTWTQVTVTYDGTSSAAGTHLYLNGQLAPVEVVRDYLYKDITYEGGEPELTLGYRFRDNGFKGGVVDDLRFYSGSLSPWEVLAEFDEKQAEQIKHKPAEQLSESEKQMLFLHFQKFHCFITQMLRGVIASCHDDINQLTKNVPEAMVMHELPRPKPAYILKRGAYDAPGEMITASTPAILPAMQKDLPRNRLGLARWLIDPQHPLTARVAVNRLWQQMFGMGLVETSDNLGTQGARPSNQDLLDWLTQEFVQPSDPTAKPWDVKRLLKMMALSATYRQESRSTAEQLAKDGDNKLLGHYPIRRLSAEMLRDQALFESGLLVEKQGGPGVKPYQPDGLWEVAMGNPKYDRGTGADLYRRSLYTYWKRTVPHPAMVTFDAAERNVCIVRRQSTSTPLQALALLNDVQMVEAAKMLGQRMQRRPGTLEDRLRWAFRQVTCQTATEKEVAVLTRLWSEQRIQYQKDAVATQKLLATGESKVDPQLPADELAANTIVALALFNHDGAVMRR